MSYESLDTMDFLLRPLKEQTASSPLCPVYTDNTLTFKSMCMPLKITEKTKSQKDNFKAGGLNKGNQKIIFKCLEIQKCVASHSKRDNE